MVSSMLEIFHRLTINKQNPELFSLSKQECLEFTLFPELIAVLLYVEALEDNEVVFVENVRQFNRISIDSNKRPFLEKLVKPKKV